jgi:RNA recognition motif-containing protein
LTEYFSQFGKVTKIILLRNKKTKESRGFGFIDFACKTSTQKCLATEHLHDGRKFNCKEAFPVECARRREENEQSKKLWLGSLAPEWTGATLTDYFSQFGAVDTCYIAREKGSEKSRKFGFLFFQEIEPVALVLEVPVHTIDGVEIEVKSLKSRRTFGAKQKKIPEVQKPKVSKSQIDTEDSSPVKCQSTKCAKKIGSEISLTSLCGSQKSTLATASDEQIVDSDNVSIKIASPDLTAEEITPVLAPQEITPAQADPIAYDQNSYYYPDYAYTNPQDYNAYDAQTGYLYSYDTGVYDSDYQNAYYQVMPEQKAQAQAQSYSQSPPMQYCQTPTTYGVYAQSDLQNSDHSAQKWAQQSQDGYYYQNPTANQYYGYQNYAESHDHMKNGEQKEYYYENAYCNQGYYA